MTLTAAQDAEIIKAVRSPRGLLKIVYSGGTIRVCTGGNVTWDSQSWLKSGVKIKDIKTGKGGIQTARISIINESNLYSEIAILGQFNFQEVTVWEYYGASPALADPVKRFYGEIVKIPSMGSEIVFDCATIGGVTKRIPNLTLGSPDLNHMPYSGQQIPIGNEIYIVEIN